MQPDLDAVTPSAPDILVGTASWTDPTLLASDRFYPAVTMSPEARLRYYASRFPIVEVDSSYYAIPARRTAELWAERTPPGFVFNMKAYALMTGQPAEVARLPKDLRAALPSELAAARKVYAKDLPREILDEVWRLFLDALEPLRAAGKLGAVLMQYPRWFIPSTAAVDTLLEGQSRLGDIAAPVELRNQRWFGEEKNKTRRTLAFFATHDIPLVIVDGPQGLESSVPPIAMVTSPRLALVRMHGRRVETWEAPNVPTVERYRYLYSARELGEWVPKILGVAPQAQRTHVLMNNCFAHYGTQNAAELTAMLFDTTGARSAIDATS